jgi:hypothetical protein
MRNPFAASLIILVLMFFSSPLLASPQMPDYIIYGKDTIVTYNLILEEYLQRKDNATTKQLFGLSFRNVSLTSCWRGYQAIYKIENDSIFLVDIIGCGERRNGRIDKAASSIRMKALFGEKFLHGKVFINWFSGDINFPLNNKVLRWDGVFYTIYIKETVINIENGKVLNVEAVDNYVDDPKRIDRKDKDKISKYLFRKLKRVKWKNKEEFECSDKYLVTIDESGNVSKVKMLYSDKEIEEYYAKDEFNFCINKMYTALKTLKFDIIKDKGKPIAEDIYIEIWVDDNGKIEDRKL